MANSRLSFQLLIFSFALLVSQLCPVIASRAILANSKVYLHLDDNSFLSFDSIENITDSQEPRTLPSPPANSTLLDSNSGDILAFYGSCGSSFQVSAFSNSTNSWQTLEVPQEAQIPYMANASIFRPPQADRVLIYGGICNSNISDSLFGFWPSNSSFVNITATNGPVPFYGAGVTTVGSANLLVGGKSYDGWIGMNQLAIWDGNEWSGRNIYNASVVDSRTDPLVLPFNSTSVLIIGGSVDGRSADPALLGLSLNEIGQWSYGVTNPVPAFANDSTISSLLSAVVLPGNIILGLWPSGTITTTTTKLSKRSTSSLFDVSLYNPTSNAFIKSYNASEATTFSTSSIAGGVSSSDDGKDQKQTTKTALAVSLPVGIVSVALAVLLIVIIARRRRRRGLGTAASWYPSTKGIRFEDDDEVEDQQFSDWYYASAYGNTLSRSWSQQRAMYDNYQASRQEEQKRQSSSTSTATTMRNSSKYGSNSILRPYLESLRSPKRKATTATAKSSLNSSAGTSTTNTTNMTNALVASHRRSTLLDDEMEPVEHSTPSRITEEPTDEESNNSNDIITNNEPTQAARKKRRVQRRDGSGDIEDIFATREVQVLVSAPRRGALRVTNPDEPGRHRQQPSRTSTLRSLASKLSRSSSNKSDASNTSNKSSSSLERVAAAVAAMRAAVSQSNNSTTVDSNNNSNGSGPSSGGGFLLPILARTLARQRELTATLSSGQHQHYDVEENPFEDSNEVIVEEETNINQRPISSGSIMSLTNFSDIVPTPPLRFTQSQNLRMLTEQTSSSSSDLVELI